MKRVRITVLHKTFFPEYADQYLTEGKSVGSCPILNVGDSFIFEGTAKMPDGFCPWAWIAIYQSVSALSAGATYTPWNREDNMQIKCCTDGIRPVIFEIRAIDEQCDE